MGGCPGSLELKAFSTCAVPLESGNGSGSSGLHFKGDIVEYRNTKQETEE